MKKNDIAPGMDTLGNKGVEAELEQKRSDIAPGLDTLGIKGVVSELEQRLQSLISGVDELTEEREFIRQAPASKDDIKRRLLTSFNAAEVRFMRTSASKVSGLTSFKERDSYDIENLFVNTVPGTEGKVKSVNVDAIAFFMKDFLVSRVEALADHLVEKNAGLPLNERMAKIEETDRRINKLDKEHQTLIEEIESAGFQVIEKYEDL